MENENENPNPNTPDTATPPPPMPSGATAPTPTPSGISTPPPQPSSQEPISTVKNDPYQASSVPDVAAPMGGGNDATFKDRALAYLIDALVVFAIYIAAALTGWVVGLVSGTLGSLVGTVGMLAGVAYFFARDCLPQLNGVSIGKKAMGIRAVTTDGQALTGNWMPGLMRNVVLMIPFFGFVEIFVLFSRTGKHPLQRLGDEWFQTKVIKSA